MDEETNLVTLSSMMERILQLENDFRELRQLVLLQKPYLMGSVHKPSTIFTKSDLPGPAVAGGSWEVKCLGNFHLRCAGRDLAPCKSQRGQSILKYLLASPGYTASAEVLMECFWPQADPAASKRNLHAAVHALRSLLHGYGPNGDDETVLFRNHCYFLNPALSIVQDVDMFRAAYQRGQRAVGAGASIEATQAFEEARTYYTGDFLADSCEEWASGHRLALQDMRLSLLSQLGSVYSQRKDWESATSCSHEILAVDCYREDVYRQLMHCYAASGRLADIKRAYLTCQKHLRCELHLPPAPETTALYQQLIQQHVPTAGSELSDF